MVGWQQGRAKWTWGDICRYLREVFSFYDGSETAVGWELHQAVQPPWKCTSPLQSRSDSLVLGPHLQDRLQQWQAVCGLSKFPHVCWMGGTPAQSATLQTQQKANPGEVCVWSWGQLPLQRTPGSKLAKVGKAQFEVRFRDRRSAL